MFGLGCESDGVFQNVRDFNADLYPDTAGNQPAMTAEEWCSGLDKEVLHSFAHTKKILQLFAKIWRVETPKKKNRQTNKHNNVS